MKKGLKILAYSLSFTLISCTHSTHGPSAVADSNWNKLSNLILPSAYAAPTAPRIATVLLNSRGGWDSPGWLLECKFANVSADYAGVPGYNVSYKASELIQARVYTNSGESSNSVFTAPEVTPIMSYTLHHGQSVTMAWNQSNTPAQPSKIVFSVSHLNPGHMGLVQGQCFYFYKQGISSPINHPITVMGGMPF